MDRGGSSMRFEIKHRLTGSVLFSIETDSWKLAVEAAVRSRANLSEANLSLANLSGANLLRANLSLANLSLANLSLANLSEADLSGANLLRANLSEADLSLANLSWANLSLANLSEADLSEADLSGANLSLANLSEADLSRAKHLNKFLTTPLYGMLDQHDPLVAYKLVTADGIGPFNGGITYTVGHSYEEPNADTDERESCGAGINLASLDWCLRHYKSGDRILIAEFQKADIAAIPIGSDGKFRVHRCRIVGEKGLHEIGIK